MHISRLKIENFRLFGEGERGLDLALKKGITSLVGENDSGKSAVIDALRFSLGTTDQEWNRLEDTDFHQENTGLEIRVTLRFDDLGAAELRAFAEYLTYGRSGGVAPVMPTSPMHTLI